MHIQNFRIKTFFIISSLFLLVPFSSNIMAKTYVYKHCATPNYDAILNNAPNLKPKILKVALKAYKNICEETGHDKRGILTVVDFTKPSSEKRTWIIDIRKNTVDTMHVAHGKRSGLLYADHFSDRRGSRASSIGCYLTGHLYIGFHGLSLRLHGLDEGFNSNAFRRRVVMHRAWYVSPNFLKKHERLGRSWGCLAFDKFTFVSFISKIKKHTIVVAYYPDEEWLSTSKYLRPYEPEFISKPLKSK